MSRKSRRNHDLRNCRTLRDTNPQLTAGVLHGESSVFHRYPVESARTAPVLVAHELDAVRAYQSAARSAKATQHLPQHRPWLARFPAHKDLRCRCRLLVLETVAVGDLARRVAGVEER
jgi:hypothetical protein